MEARHSSASESVCSTKIALLPESDGRGHIDIRASAIAIILSYLGAKLINRCLEQERSLQLAQSYATILLIAPLLMSKLDNLGLDRKPSTFTGLLDKAETSSLDGDYLSDQSSEQLSFAQSALTEGNSTLKNATPKTLFSSQENQQTSIAPNSSAEDENYVANRVDIISPRSSNSSNQNQSDTTVMDVDHDPNNAISLFEETTSNFIPFAIDREIDIVAMPSTGNPLDLDRRNFTPFGNSGIEHVINSQSETITLQGLGGNDALRDSSDRDDLLGNTINDRLVGGDRDDVLNGVANTSTPIVGSGRDRFFLNLSNHNTMETFHLGEDHMSLLNGLTYSSFSISPDSNNNLISSNNQILEMLIGIQNTSLIENFFIDSAI